MGKQTWVVALAGAWVISGLSAMQAVAEDKAPTPASKPSSRPASMPASQRAEVYEAFPFDAKEAAKRQDDTAKALGIRKEVAVDLGGKVTMKFILIPAGKFLMGSPGSQREVTIARPYYLAVYKVTQAQYEQVTSANPSSVKGKDFPVHQVTWEDALAFCQKAAKKTGKAIRLPTEAEWENACRAGANTKFFWGDDESKLGDYVWYRENMDGKMHAVGQKKPNAWGLYDINGLMWEYCRIGEVAPKADAKETFKDFATRGATWGSRPPMFVLGVRMPVGETKPASQPASRPAGPDRYGMRVAMDAE